MLPEGGIEQPTPEPDHEQRKLILLGQMMEMMLYKKEGSCYFCV